MASLVDKSSTSAPTLQATYIAKMKFELHKIYFRAIIMRQIQKIDFFPEARI